MVKDGNLLNNININIKTIIMRDNIGKFSKIKYDREGYPVDKKFSSKKKEKDYIIEYIFTSAHAFNQYNKQDSWFKDDDRNSNVWSKYGFTRNYSKADAAIKSLKDSLKHKKSFFKYFDNTESKNEYNNYIKDREFRIRCLRTNEIIEIDKYNI